MQNQYDTIVAGLGAVGSATIYQLSKSSKNVLGIDKFTPPHTHGSSHGKTRLIRQAVGEGSGKYPIFKTPFLLIHD